MRSSSNPLNGLGAGLPLDSGSRAFFEPRFGADFSGVRVHDGADAADAATSVQARAFTSGQDVVFGSGEYAPTTTQGQKLLAHELTHVVQQSSGATAPFARKSSSATTILPADSSLEQDADRVASSFSYTENLPPVRSASEPGIMRDPLPGATKQADPYTIEIVAMDRGVTEYTRPTGGLTHRLGEAAGPNILTRIFGAASGHVHVRWFNFARGQIDSGTLEDWEFRQAVAGAFSATETERFAAIGRQFSSSQWQAMDKDPTSELMAKFEAGSLSINDEAVLTTYKGMIHAEAERTLNQNEAQIDALLGAPDRIKQIEDYSQGLREASQVRDALEQITARTKAELLPQREELNHRLVQSQGFTFGFAGTFINQDSFQRMRTLQQIGQIDQQIASKEEVVTFWKNAFPLLTRLKTEEINPASIMLALNVIKANIISTRSQLERAVFGRGSLDLMDLSPIREKVNTRLGARAGNVIAAEDKSRARWSIAGSVALLAGSIALLFIPGGVFIDAAIGVALAAKSIDDAIITGRAANTGLNVDDGLMSQAQADSAKFQAIIGTIFAAIGTLGAGFKVLRVARVFSRLGSVAPELSAASKINLARLIVSNPELIKQLRTVAEVEELLKTLGKSLMPAEVEAIRALAKIEVASRGRIIIAAGRTLSPEELAMANRLSQEGRVVEAVAEGTQRTSDFIVDGIPTELKTISNITSKDISGALGRRILDGAGQAPHIIADTTGQAGMTLELAQRAIRRAYGAEKLNRITQIRVIGQGFDITVPRLP